MPGLIPCPQAIWLAVTPVDLRLGADGLSLQVQQALHSTHCGRDCQSHPALSVRLG